MVAYTLVGHRWICTVNTFIGSLSHIMVSHKAFHGIDILIDNSNVMCTMCSKNKLMLCSHCSSSQKSLKLKYMCVCSSMS